MAQSAADRRRAQRRLAKEIHENRYQRVAPKGVHEAGRKAQKEFANSRLGKNNDKLPDAEKKQLARMAAYAAQGRGNPDYEEFKKYWYHND